MATTVAGGHGRRAERRLETSDVLVGDRDWPGLAHGCHLARQVSRTKTGEGREEVVCGVTRLAPARADATRWLAWVRGHWHSANTSHGVREVPCDAERSQVRGGSIPQGRAGRRNPGIGLMRGAG